MKSTLKISAILSGLLLVACGGGSSSSSGSGNPSVGNFTQLTPTGGVHAPQSVSTTNNIQTLNPLPSYDYFTIMSVSNQGTLYAGTAYGYVYQIDNVNSGFSSFNGTAIVTPNPVGNSIIAFGANQNSYAYTTLNESTTTLGTASTGIQSESPITALTLAANGITYYGTLDGQVHIVGGNADVTPFSTNVCIDPNFCPVTAIGLTSNNAASGKKGVAALQLSESIPLFNGAAAESGTWASTFRSAVACLEQAQGNSGEWVQDNGSGIPTALSESYSYTYVNESGQTVESSVITNVPQFITTMLASTSDMIYVGTNLFNVYSTSGCNQGWSQVNTTQLANLQDGSIGITSVGLVNSQLFVVTNNTESVINAYQYQGTVQ